MDFERIGENRMSKESKKVFLMIVSIVVITALPYLKEGLCAYFPDLMYHLLRTEGVKEAILSGEYPAFVHIKFSNNFSIIHSFYIRR